ncbi:CRACD-like protein isoform X1 [Oryzias melastigma]|uniref:KIAA1211 like n=2 Tax=Oryzias melastigma TaxID=30732 RepID=A0A3B3BY13_ORYME|nr:CRACD-like protein isoform X1 [Oryzias melastigma]XP_024141976.1 CRACD-like protein isoform X1 [Oryzias melastigma]
MESFSGDAEEGTEDLAGNKKFKIKSLKTRLFRKSKKSASEKAEKLTQSASDITFAERLGSDEDLLSGQRIMGSRALSHDSIFLSEEGLEDPEPPRILSQENVHGKIKALQMKLQLQKMHFGPPPSVLPVRSPDSEDKSGHSEDLLFQSSHETSGETVTPQGILNKTQLVYPPLCPFPNPAPIKSLSPTFSNPWSFSAPQNSPTSTAEPPLDFSTPPRALSRLDSSAARHRMSVKPRNQRASTKKKISSVSQSESFPHVPNNKEESEKEQEEKDEIIQKSEEEVPQELLVTFEETPPITLDPPLKPSSLSFPQLEPAVLPEVFQVTPDVETVDAASSELSSFLESELNNKRELVTSHEKTNTGTSEVPSDQISSHLRSRSPSEILDFRGITRPSPGSGSFHFSNVRSGDEDRPRSSSFVLKQAEALHKQEEKSVKDKEDLKSFQLKGSPFALGRFKPEGASVKASVAPWEKKESIKAEGPASPTKTVPAEAVTLETEEVDSYRGQLEETEKAQDFRGITRPSPGSGSFHFSNVRSGDEDRPRSRSFVLKQAEALHKQEEKSVKDKEDLKSFQLKGSPFALGRFKPEGASIKASVAPWEKKESTKAEEPASPTKEAVTPETQEVDSYRGQLEEAEKAQEEEKKTAFGIKLRATSQSIKYRSEAAPNRLSKTIMQEEFDENPKKLEVYEKSSETSEKLPISTSSTLRPTDPAPAGVSFQKKHNIPPTDNLASANSVQTSSCAVKEAELQPSPQTSSSSEVSWISLAMEKTRTIQQLFTSRLSRDSGAQPQPTAQSETMSGQQNPTVSSSANQPTADKKAAREVSSTRFLRDVVDQTEIKIVPETQSETLKCQQHPTQTPNQSLSDTVREETLETSVKPSIVVKRQKIASPALSHTSRESHSFKQTKEDLIDTSLHTSQSPSPSALPANPWATLSPLRSASQTVSSSHPEPPAQTSVQQQQTPWSIPLKSTTAAQTPASAAPPTDSESEEKESPVQKEAPSLSVRRAVWTGSASDRAVFLEKRAAWTTTPVIKGVELRKPQTEIQTTGDPPSPARVTPSSKDTTADGKQWGAESSPFKVPERPRDEKWLRRNLGSTPSPSSSPTQPSVLQSMSDSGQPSWMELAKRKSMAWSDKTMD